MLQAASVGILDICDVLHRKETLAEPFVNKCNNHMQLIFSGSKKHEYHPGSQKAAFDLRQWYKMHWQQDTDCSTRHACKVASFGTSGARHDQDSLQSPLNQVQPASLINSKSQHTMHMRTLLDPSLSSMLLKDSEPEDPSD